MRTFHSETGNEIDIKPKTLLVFLDETGHEEFSDENYPLFGIGGCVISGEYYDSQVVNPWEQLKKEYFGSIDIGLHACEMYESTSKQKQAISEFFRLQRFSRVASILTDKSCFSEAPKIDKHNLLAKNLMDRIVKVAVNYNFDHALMIFEDSQRLKPFYEKYFTEFSFAVSNKSTTVEIPTTKFVMPKSTKEPGLEVADFIIHTAGGNALHIRNRNEIPKNRRDFNAVFADVDNALESYYEIVKVEMN